MKIENIRGHHICTDSLGPDSVAVDLGACEGEFSQAVGTRWGARVLAVEANPVMFEKTYADENVTKFNLAIADKVGAVRLYLADNPEGNSLKEQHRDVSKNNYVEISATTLANFIREQDVKKVDVLKVDIEGSEIDLFASLEDEMLQGFDQVSVEFHDFIDTLKIGPDVAAIKRRMQRLGFGCIVYCLPNKDVLFVNLRAKGISSWGVFYHRIRARVAIVFHGAWNMAKGSLKSISGR